MQGVPSGCMTLFVTSLSQAVILHAVSAQSRARQRRLGSAPTDQLRGFRPALCQRRPKPKDGRGVCVRRKTSLRFSGRMANSNCSSEVPSFCRSKLRDWIETLHLQTYPTHPSRALQPGTADLSLCPPRLLCPGTSAGRWV